MGNPKKILWFITDECFGKQKPVEKIRETKTEKRFTNQKPWKFRGKTVKQEKTGEGFQKLESNVSSDKKFSYYIPV